MPKRKRKRDAFDDLSGAALGTAGVGLSVGVAGAVGARGAALGAPSVTGGLATLGSMTGLTVTVVGAGAALKGVRKLKKKRRRR